MGAPCSDPLYSCQAGECRCKPENYCQGKSGSSYICVDTQTNPNYCGTCANAQYPKECLPFPGWSCVAGECLCPDSEKCDGKCVNLFTDSEHCGACGRTCPVALGGFCSAGTCYCGASNEPTKLVCAGACVDVASDVQHCGKCDNACTAAPGSTVSCKAGVCVQQLVCPPDVGDCDGDASNGCETNLKKDGGNCGACGTNCGFLKGPWCNNGTCASCPTQPCGGVCVDQKTDPMNCGGCGIVCVGGQTCVAGGCL